MNGQDFLAGAWNSLVKAARSNESESRQSLPSSLKEVWQPDIRKYCPKNTDLIAL